MAKSIIVVALVAVVLVSCCSIFVQSASVSHSRLARSSSTSETKVEDEVLHQFPLYSFL